MASKKDRKAKARQEKEIDAPDGFDINVGRERGEGWIVKEEGNEILGRLLGRNEYKNSRGKTRAFYQIQLERSCKIQIENPDFNEEADEDDDNKEFIESEGMPGMIVNVDEFKKLEDLKEYTRDGGVYDVWFVMGGKIDLGPDQSMWTLKAGPRLKPIKLPERRTGEKNF